MTTSALSTNLVSARLAVALDHAPNLEDQLQRGEGGDVPIVEWRGDLNHIEADDARPLRRAAQQLERLPGRQTARRRYLGARRKGWIQHADVERNVDLLAGQPV